MKSGVRIIAVLCAFLLAALMLPIGMVAAHDTVGEPSIAAVPESIAASDTFGAEAPAKSWYFAEGAAGAGLSTWILISNPGDATADCEVTFMVEGGAPVQNDYSVVARSTIAISLGDVIGDGSAATKVISNVPVVVGRMFGSDDCTTSAVGTTAPSNTWYFAEGTTRSGWEPYLLLQNPNAGSNNVTVTYYFATGGTQVQNLNIGATSRKTIDVASVVGADKDVFCKVEGVEEIVVERTVFHNNRNVAFTTFGMTSTEKKLFLAAGTNQGAVTWIIVWNPGGNEANINMTYMTQNGAKAGPVSVVAPNSRQTIMMDEADAATKIESDQPVVIERVMYDPEMKAWGTCVAATADSSASWYFPSGATTTGLETQILLQNANDSQASVTIDYYTISGTVTDTFDMAPNTRKTVLVHETLPDTYFSARVQGTKDLVAECAIYKTGGYTGSFYLAEGYTGTDFQEYLCIGNASDSKTTADVTYMFPDGTTQEESYEVNANSRFTVDVNSAVGSGKEVSVKVDSECSSMVVERPMYFDYQGIYPGGHDVIATPSPSTDWYFAEGTTLSGFDEYITVQNPCDTQANLTFHYMVQGEGESMLNDIVGPNSRATFTVRDQVGDGKTGVSLYLESDQQVVAERPMYFNYGGLASNNWEGGHCVVGANSTSRTWYFAEGTTRSGFEEWLCIQNPSDDEITVYATYVLGEGQGDPVNESYAIPAHSRQTISVNNELGEGKDVSTNLVCETPFIAERPLYFNYNGTWAGGHDVLGANSPANTWYFAEGYTGNDFREFLSIMNTTGEQVQVTITYYPENGEPIVKNHTVDPDSRYTVDVNEDAGSGLSISAKVEASKPVVVERPMYFNYGGWPGGHDVVGYTSTD